MALVLIVDDVQSLAEQYAYDLKRVGGYETMIVTGGKEALEAITGEAIDCVILDLEMPVVDGFEVLRTLRKRGIELPVIVYTGTGDYDRCVQAMRLGAFGFIDKGESMERVAREVENALERVRLHHEIASLRRELDTESGLIGSSQAMQELKTQISRVADIPSTVLIVGESGTGKELVARELHRLAADGSTPFVAVNSAALPDNLIESELFGHERGAFTGANRTHKGAFEQASRGILFLDEIGELPLQAQAKLLRVLEDRTVTRVGGERTVKVDVRVIAATNRDLETAATEGAFRQDLFYRLNVHFIRVPPLRDHRSDIPELVDHFLTSTCTRFGVRRKRVHRDALEVLMAHEWRRNNVRELKNAIERMVIASDGDIIELKHVPAELQGATSARGRKKTASFQERKAEAERQIIVAALERNDWHITRTAEELGLADHASLLKIMRRHDLKRS
jgi:two-component system nitrogen regulation response regulator NtrX